MPTIITRGAAAVTSLGFGASGGSHWVARLSNVWTGYKVRAQTLAIDSAGSVTVVGNDTTNASLTKGIMASFDTGGNLRYQKLVRDPNNQFMYLQNDGDKTGIVTDSSGNVYLVGTSTYSYSVWIGKYNSSGTFVSSKTFNMSDSSANVIMHFDGTHIYMVRGDANATIKIFKMDTSLNIVWQKHFGTGGGGNDMIMSEAKTDSSGNVYICGKWSSSPDGGQFGASNDRPLIIKYNSSGTLLWDYYIDFGVTPSYIDNANSFDFDSSGNLYVIGRYYGTGTRNYMCKISPAGSLLANNLFYTPYGFGKLIIDSSGNLHIHSGSMILKFNSSLVPTQNNNYGGGADGLEMSNFILSPTGDYIITGYGDSSVYVARVPSDASKRGSYTVGGQTFSIGGYDLPTVYGASTPTLVNFNESAYSSSFSTSNTTPGEENPFYTAAVTPI